MEWREELSMLEDQPEEFSFQLEVKSFWESFDPNNLPPAPDWVNQIPGIKDSHQRFSHQQSEESSVETEEFSMVSEEFSDGCPAGMECDPARCVDGRCKGGSELFMFLIAFFIALPILCCLCRCLKGREQIENLEMIESEDEVIKTYQVAKMIISGTDFESLQLTVLQMRLHFVCISEYIVMRCQVNPSTYTGYKTILGGDTDE